MARLTLGHRLARVHPFVWIGATAAAAALIAWPLGGWDTVELQSTKVPQVEPGATVDGQPFAVAVDSIETTGVHPDGFSEPDPGWEYLILDLTVTNMTDQTQFSLNLGDGVAGAVTVDDGAIGWGSHLEDPDGFEVHGQAYLHADDTLLPDLQPRLASPLRLVWDVPAGTWRGGDEVTVGIVGRTPYQQVLSTGTGYRSPVVVATVRLTVRQGAAAPAEETAP